MEPVNKPFDFKFRLESTENNARAGVFSTPHGELLTPVFAPVGTQATVKSVSPSQLAETGATLVLSNTYHLYLRPGPDLVAEFGGLQNFMQWHGPMLTDSGGFQVFSLSDTRKIDEEGVNFKSHIDGSMHRFTPEKSIEIQEQLGADIIMAFDECSDPNNEAYTRLAMERTHRWAERSRNAHKRTDQALFGIVQGGISPDLRRTSAEFISGLDFPGNAIGGLSVGETKEEMAAMLEVVNPILPADKPRYLMGVGSPEDLVNGILRGVDIFDCVLPTRLARHNTAMTRQGKLNLMNLAYARDKSSIEEGCSCYTCNTFTRGYLRHLIVAKEMLAATLISIHNIHMLVNLVKDCRTAIIEDRFSHFADHFLQNYRGKL
ncbi:MAG TPA: tRNA guanosine(34) transglycosylase Tgt [Bellilinea sp.]|nr:tRNA guanosine(34) transglycosylase Tgt [Bellilinea sp.]